MSIWVLCLLVQDGKLHLRPRLDSVALGKVLTLVDDKKILSITNAEAIFSQFVDPKVRPNRLPDMCLHLHWLNGVMPSWVMVTFT